MSAISSSLVSSLAAGVAHAALEAVGVESTTRRLQVPRGVRDHAPDLLVGISSEAARRAVSGGKASATKAKSKTSSSSASKAGYASGSSLPKDLAFLNDPKLSLEDKLMRFMAYMNAKYEADVTQKMKEMGGGEAAKAGGASGTGSTTAPKKKKKGFFGKFLDTVKTAMPALGLTFQLLKNPTTRKLLGQLGGPVLGAAATALGFPAAGPFLAKLGPKVVDYAAAGLSAIEKAAKAEESAGAASGGGGGSGGGTSGASGANGKSEQMQMLELQRAVEKQKEMFAMVTNMLRAFHDSRMQIINNLR